MISRRGTYMNLTTIKTQLQQTQPAFIGEDSAFRSAVVVPLVEVNDELHVLFEVRSLTMRKQPGILAFQVVKSTRQMLIQKRRHCVNYMRN